MFLKLNEFYNSIPTCPYRESTKKPCRASAWCRSRCLPGQAKCTHSMQMCTRDEDREQVVQDSDWAATRRPDGVDGVTFGCRDSLDGNAYKMLFSVLVKF